MKTVIANLDQIVFENREHAYGGYELRTNYQRRLNRALLIAFLFFLTITALPLVIAWANAAPIIPDEKEITMIDVKLNLPPVPELEDTPEPPALPPAKTPPPVKTIAFFVPDPKPIDLDTATIAMMDSTLDANPDLFNSPGDSSQGYNWDNIDSIGNGNPFVEKPDKKPEIGPNEFVMLEKEPAPVNMDELKKLIGYPTMAKEAEIEGKVVLRIQVDGNGNYVKHIVIKDPHPILTTEVSKQIRNLKFTPGIQAGKPIKVWVTIPFDFKLMR